MKKDKVVELFKDIIAQELKIDANEIDGDELFLSIGLDSVSCIVVLDKLEKEIVRDLNPILFWDYPTINSFAQHLAEDTDDKG
jgi:acyl carrier protein